ncbi:MAG: sulfite exporter TauE/SafE family protein [Planctomycetes bacterium]|nr:sulfite exporter TauE/SafE family protein [Planctomycetota bacterium]
MFLQSPIFRVWLIAVVALWGAAFLAWNDIAFLAEHWYYPAVMVVGAFVAGSTPEGGGAVAFPALSVFLSIDRVLARDFSLMIQSVGMTSASIFLLTRRGVDRSVFLPLLWWVPVAFVGFVVGMFTLQGIRVPVIQALFLSLIMAFALAYWRSAHRGVDDHCRVRGRRDVVLCVLVLLLGGLCTSLFGTGADILVYTLLVTHFTMRENQATELSIVLMAAMSLLGFAWRGLVQREVTDFQIRTWLCAAPVALLMAPLGAHVLRRMPAEWLLRAVVALNVGQLAWFNLRQPTLEKMAWSIAFSLPLLLLFSRILVHVQRRAEGRALAVVDATD